MSVFADEFQAVQAQVQLQNQATAQNDGVTAEVRISNHSTISDDGDATAAAVTVKKGAAARGSNAKSAPQCSQPPKRCPATGQAGLQPPMMKKSKRNDIDDAALESVLNGQRPPAVVPGTPAFRPGPVPGTPAASGAFVVPGLTSVPSTPGPGPSSVPATPGIGVSPSVATDAGDLDTVSGDKVDIRAVLNGAKLGREIRAVSFFFHFCSILLSMHSAGLCVWAARWAF